VAAGSAWCGPRSIRDRSLPFAASVAVSRVVLDLHYPSDVLAATLIGSVLAGISIALAPGVALPVMG